MKRLIVGTKYGLYQVDWENIPYILWKEKEATEEITITKVAHFKGQPTDGCLIGSKICGTSLRRSKDRLELFKHNNVIAGLITDVVFVHETDNATYIPQEK